MSKVSAYSQAMVPRPDVPRARFQMARNLKTSFDSSYLIPVLCEEVLPGDTFKVKMTAFVRMATPIFPVMDNVYVESFFFFVPNRLVWNNWQRFMGEQDDPGDSTDYTVPGITANSGGYPIGSVFDYFGLPTAGQVAAGGNVPHSALPLRGYNLIWNLWFRDQNLQDSVTVPKTDGPDSFNTYNMLRRNKRHDYFTGCLPWPQKGPSVSLPLGTTAPVRTSATALLSGAQPAELYKVAATGAVATTGINMGTGVGGAMNYNGAFTNGTASGDLYPSNLYADLAQATAATINQIREAFQIQKLLERDARGGTRYTEILRAHFGVTSQDSRLQRPEYLGGGTSMVTINAVPQTSGTAATPQGNLSAFGVGTAQHGFSQSFVEHGYIIGLVNVRADLTYQQGLRRHWSRRTRYDFYFPAFAHLGEQAVLNKEIYARGDVNDALVFGYQERWAELRYAQSEVTSLMRSTAVQPIDAWHLAQEFSALPTLSSTFIEDRPPMQRVLAVGSEAVGQEFLGDFLFQMNVTRPIPLYSVPGFVDRF